MPCIVGYIILKNDEKKEKRDRYMRKTTKKIVSVALSAALVVTGAYYQNNEVSAAKKVKKVTLNKKSATLYVGATKAYSTITLKATVKPKKAAKVKFTTSNKKVATVSSKGVVKAKKAGKAVITAKAGSKKVKCKITVKKITKKIKSIKVKKKSVSIYVGKTSQISTTITPKKVTLKKLAYTSSNKKVATVSASGKIKGIKAGKATITVAAVDGSKKKATVKVTVKKKVSTATATPAPTATASTAPSTEPTVAPTEAPVQPTVAPTQAPVQPTAVPTQAPSTAPSTEPSTAPTEAPSTVPSTEPSAAPTEAPSTAPSAEPTAKVVTPDVKDGMATYTLDTTKDHTVAYNDRTVTATAKDFDTILSYVSNIAKLENSNGNLETGYDKFVKNIKSFNGLTLDAGSVNVEFVSSIENVDTYKVTVSGVKDFAKANGTYTVTVTKTKTENTVSYLINAANADETNTVSATVSQSERNEVVVSGVKAVYNGTVRFALDSVKLTRNTEKTTDGKIVTTVSVSDAANVVINRNGEKKFNVSKATVVLTRTEDNKNIKVEVKDVISDNAKVNGKTMTVDYDEVSNTVKVTVPNTDKLNKITITESVAK